MIRRVSVLLLMSVAVLAVGVSVCQAQPQSLMTRHVRDVVVNGQAPFVGRMPATQSIRFDIVLPVRDQAGLDNLLEEVYDPSSPNYRDYLTVEQFTERFGPSQKDWDGLVRFAKANGFKVVGGSRDGMDLQLRGSVVDIETAFHVTMGLYHDPIANRDFYAVDREPTVDLPFELWHITGLDNYSIPRPALVHRPKGAQRAATTGSCPGASFCGSDMRAAYYEGKSLTGKGQNIALFELAGTDLADLTAYYKGAKQKKPYTPTLISTGGYSTKCLYSSGCDDTEQTIDMTQAMGMAPGSKMLYMYVCGNGSEFSETACFSAMVATKDAPLSLQISSSWFWSPPDPKTDDPYFKKMAAQGQSIFNASGDWGAWPGSENFYYPSDDPYVISVGGTDLTTKGAGKGWASEVAWTPYTGGGISPDDFTIPSWQKIKGVINKSNQGSTQYRNGPDVSANANFTFYVCADQGQNPYLHGECAGNVYGGTSFAAPMWAGYLALVNEQAASKKDKPAGFINPTVYKLSVGKTYGTLFHDITSGDNGPFKAVKGYDLVTGWGSPNTDGLINALAP
jgi:subtilase family serine protease